MITTVPRDWQNLMACAGTLQPLWDFRIDPPGAETDGLRALRLHEGKKYCRTCPVQDPCLEWAMEDGTQSGLWGGVLFDAGEIVALPKRPRYTRESQSMSTSESKQTVALEASRERTTVPVRPRTHHERTGDRT